jgi:hypothetical protein
MLVFTRTNAGTE